MSGWVTVDPFTIAIHLNRFLVKDMGSEVSSRSSSCSTPEKIKNNTKRAGKSSEVWLLLLLLSHILTSGDFQNLAGESRVIMGIKSENLN